MTVLHLVPVVATAAVLVLGWTQRPIAPARLPAVDSAPLAVRGAPPRRQKLALGGIALVVVALLSPVAAVLVGAAVGGRVALRRRAFVERARRDLVDELPEVVDLLALAVSAGLTVPLALRIVAERGVGSVAHALGSALDESERGVSLVDSLEAVVDELGDLVRGLVRVLVGSLRDGTPSAPALERLAVEVRVDRRRAVEVRAKQLPVRLLFPLVVCVLPAFGLLTVVPLLAGSLAGIEW